jgi:hypothetical protein
MIFGNLKRLEEASKDMPDLERRMFEANVLGRLCANIPEKEFAAILERAALSFVKVTK